MYKLLGALSATDAPLVFKGALITKLALAEKGFTEFERQTKDIDANWIGSPPTMEQLVNKISSALSSQDGYSSLEAVATRAYAEKKSAGIAIVNKDSDKELLTIDISIKPVIDSRVYYLGEIGIRGVLPTEILTDKLHVLSTKYVFRRAKDLADTYALAHCTRVTTAELYDILAKKGRAFGEFTEFTTRRDEIEHAYEKLRGVENKPRFEEVYAYLEKFVRPLAEKSDLPIAWRPESSSWVLEPQRAKCGGYSVCTQLPAETNTSLTDAEGDHPKKSKRDPEL
jgi:hypothetical protein